MNIQKKAVNSNSNAGFTAMHAVMAVGLVAVVVLAFFGLPSGVKDFFAKFTGNSGGLASISSFGDFGTEDTADLANLNIDEVAKTIYTDLTNVQAATKSEEKDIKNGICFKNPSGNSGNEKDFYNIVSDVRSDSACADGESIETVVSLPGTTVFTDPASNTNKSVVFNKDGTITATKDVSIKISNSTGVRMVVVTPEGVITYTDKISGTISGSNGSVSGANGSAANNNSAEAARLRNIAAGLGNVINGLQNLQNQRSVPAVPTLGASSTNGQIYLSWSRPAAPASYPITFFKLYRGTHSNGEVLVLTLNSNITSYVDVGLAYGTYYYKISAVNQIGEGIQSNEVAIITSYMNSNFNSYAATAPANPAYNFSVSAQNGQAVLSWINPAYTGTSSIAAYRIYRNLSSGGFSLIGETGSTSYADANLVNGQTYCYYVTVRNATNESVPTDTKCAVVQTNLSNNAYIAPSGSSNGSYNSYTVPNNASSNSGSNSNNSYVVPNSSSNSNSYTVPNSSSNASNNSYTVPSSNSSNSYTVPNSTSNTSTSSNSYIVPSSGSNNSYTVPNSSSNVSNNSYTVPSSNVSTANSYVVPNSNSNTNSYTVPNSSSNALNNSYVVPAGNSLANSYTVPSSNGASTSNSYVVPSASNSYTVPGTGAASASSNSYTVPSSANAYVVPGTNLSNSYTVANIVSSYIAPTPNLAPTAPGAPGNLRATVYPNSTITLNWDLAPLNGASVPTYRIYRSFSAGGAKELVHTTAGCSCANGLPAPLPGQAFYYVVKGVSSGGEGPQSNEVLVSNSVTVPTSNSYTVPSTNNTYTVPTVGATTYTLPTTGGTYTVPTVGSTYTVPTVGGSNTYTVPTTGSNTYTVPTTSSTTYTVPTVSSTYTVPTIGGTTYTLPTTGSTYTVPTVGSTYTVPTR